MTTEAQRKQRRIMSSQLFTAKRERERKAEENRRGAAEVGTDAEVAAYLLRRRYVAQR